MRKRLPTLALLTFLALPAWPTEGGQEEFNKLAKEGASFLAVKENPRLFLGKLAKVEGSVLGVATRPDKSVAFLLKDNLSGAVVYIEGWLPEGGSVEAGKKVAVVGEVAVDERSASPWLKLQALKEMTLPPPTLAKPVEEPKEGPRVTPLGPVVLLPPMPIGEFEIVAKRPQSPTRPATPPSPGLPSRFTRARRERGRTTSRGGLATNDPLQSWIVAWKGSTVRVIKFFNSSLSEALLDRIANALLSASYKHSVDPRLMAAVVAAESRFNPKAVSRKGAMGLGQIMPENAASLGIDPFNIEQNLDATAYYLRRYLDRYAGRPNQIELALAAYNAGPNAVARHGGIPPYRETQNYIKLVLYYYRCLKGER